MTFLKLEDTQLRQRRSSIYMEKGKNLIACPWVTSQVRSMVAKEALTRPPIMVKGGFNQRKLGGFLYHSIVNCSKGHRQKLQQPLNRSPWWHRPLKSLNILIGCLKKRVSNVMEGKKRFRLRLKESLMTTNLNMKPQLLHIDLL